MMQQPNLTKARHDKNIVYLHQSLGRVRDGRSGLSSKLGDRVSRLGSGISSGMTGLPIKDDVTQSYLQGTAEKLLINLVPGRKQKTREWLRWPL